MKARLLKSTVEKFPAQARPVDVWDTEFGGLVLRVLPTGRRSFYFVYRLKGRRSRFLLGVHPQITPDGARALAHGVARDVAHGIDPNEKRQAERRSTERERASSLRVFLAERYKPWALAHLKSGAEQVARIEADFAAWLDKPMGDVTPWLIEGYRRKRREAKRSPKTINRELQRLRSVVAKAVAWGVLDVHPFAAVKPLKTDRMGRVRYLSTQEEAALRAGLVARDEKLRAARDRFNEWRVKRGRKALPARTEAFPDHLRPMVLVALNTGMRRGELLSLVWGDVDLEAKLLTVRGVSAKSGQTRRIPLNAEALAVLTGWKEQHGKPGAGAFVFPGASGERLGRVDKAWDTACAEAGLADFRFHDLRHTFASKLVMAGVPLNTVRELLGHTSIEMTLRYAHLAPDNLAQAVEKLAAPAVPAETRTA